MKHCHSHRSFFKECGFTLIELLLVIAIIGILAAVIIPRFQNARLSGADASTRQAMSSVRAQSDVYFNTAGFTYNGFCDSEKVTAVLAGVVEYTGGVAPVCNDDSEEWAAAALLITPASTTYWCIDHTGFVGETENELDTDTECS